MQHVANLTRREEARQEQAAIEVANLSHVYAGAQGAVPALEDISMRVGAGRFVVIVGPSGCGKTSLLMMLAGLRAQTEGTILCHGRPIPDPDPQRVGVIFQEASLYPLAHGAGQHRIPAQPARRPAGRAHASAPKRCSSWSAWRASASAIRTSFPAA